MIGSLEEAFDQLEAFSSVQRGRFTLEAVNLLQESVGIADAERRLIVERMDDVAPDADAQTGALLLGVIVGLLAAGYGDAG